MRYDGALKDEIRELRRQGYTYTEIQGTLHVTIPKPSLTYICRNITLGVKEQRRIKRIVKHNSQLALKKAVQANKAALDQKIRTYNETNSYLAEVMCSLDAQKIALAMLYLGEGAKWQTSRAPKLASTSPLIICLYIDLLKSCYGISVEKLRARVQCRADQDTDALVAYWARVTKIPPTKFYACYIDKRTVGHKTRTPNYKGVCTIMSAGTHVQLELEQISSIIGRAMRGISAVG